MVLHCQFGKKKSAHNCLISHATCSVTLYQLPDITFSTEYFTSPGHTSVLQGYHSLSSGPYFDHSAECKGPRAKLR